MHSTVVDTKNRGPSKTETTDRRCHVHPLPPSIRYDEWQTTYAAWQKENPDKAAMLQDGIDHKTPSVDELMAAIPEFDQDTDIATRIAGQMVLQVNDE